METIDLRLRLPSEELLDAAEDLERLFESERAEEFLPPFRRLLLALDDAITDAYVLRHHRDAGARHADAGALRARV